MSTTLGTLNPFRYRGYAYDEETGLYYLRSRYYNPVWGRFVNGDSVLGQAGGIFNHNLFAYCYNSPSDMSDTSGNLPFHCVSDAAAGAGSYANTGNDMVLKAAPSLSTLTLEAIDFLDISLPPLPYDIISESTNSKNVTTVILQTSESVLSPSLTNLHSKIKIGENVTTYTFMYSWKYHRNFRDWYEYNSVNSCWFETALAIGEEMPGVGAAITLTEDFIVKPIVESLPHTSDPDRKIFRKILYVNHTVFVKTTK